MDLNAADSILENQTGLAPNQTGLAQNKSDTPLPQDPLAPTIFTIHML